MAIIPAAYFPFLMLGFFLLGYLAIIFEYPLKINKTATALMMAVITWSLLYLGGEIGKYPISLLNEYLGKASQIIFFLLGAMTLVELIDSHKGFQMIMEFIQTHKKINLLWVIGFFSFFLSAILDNLTTTVLMILTIRKFPLKKEDRLLLGAAVVISANAGGAWTPIGDVTTTMLWIHDRVSTGAIMKSLFLPSLVSMVISLFLIGMQFKEKRIEKMEKIDSSMEPGGKIVFLSGILALIFVPIFREITGLPPVMGMLFSLGALWLITDLLHHRDETRHYLRIPHILTKIDTSGILFFLGILMSIDTLEIIGFLQGIALWLDRYITNLPLIATLIGSISAVVDNVPLVAACIGMYDLQAYPIDSPLWQIIAYSSATGGSILLIGSAAGIALMGMERISFIWYFKKISLIAFLGFLSGMFVYFLL